MHAAQPRKTRKSPYKYAYVTHYRLDVRAQIREDTRVKKSSAACVFAVLSAILLTPACKPQGLNSNELRGLEHRNSQLRQEIADMNQLIRQAGEDVPDLADQLEARKKEVVAAYETLKKLRGQEADVRMRRIELEGRLEIFRSKFQSLQSQVAPSSKSES